MNTFTLVGESFSTYEFGYHFLEQKTYQAMLFSGANSNSDLQFYTISHFSIAMPPTH